MWASSLLRRYASSSSRAPQLRAVPATIPPAPTSSPSISFSSVPKVKTAQEIEGIRRACTMAASVLQAACRLVKPGITTDEIDRAVHEDIISRNAYPAPLNYKGFPKSLCTSVNDCVCHGIPSNRVLLEGDIINLDVTVYVDGFHGDTSATVPVGRIDHASKELCSTTERCLYAAIAACRPGRSFSTIGNVIEELANAQGYSVFEDFVGHGIGRIFHEPPVVQHTRNQGGPKMQPGMVFTIEPILTRGSTEWAMWDDGWTVVSLDGERSAQFEHTVLITDDGAEILTRVK